MRDKISPYLHADLFRKKMISENQEVIKVKYMEKP